MEVLGAKSVPGHFSNIRLYWKYRSTTPAAIMLPLVLHTPMDPVLLLIASLGVPRLDVFPWPTPPPAEAVATDPSSDLAGHTEEHGENTKSDSLEDSAWERGCPPLLALARKSGLDGNSCVGFFRIALLDVHSSKEVRALDELSMK